MRGVGKRYGRGVWVRDMGEGYGRGIWVRGVLCM